MIVLSLFDGMSCGQIALRDMGIPVTRYYASEIDKWAIQQTQLNFPDTVQLGDVRNVEARTLGHIDLLIGGSPARMQTAQWVFAPLPTLPHMKHSNHAAI